MNNKTSYIYVAAVNLYSLFSQSENLSIYRGASLKLREATVRLSHYFDGKINKISVGASTGLYSCASGNESEICEQITLHLNKHYFGYTFVVVNCNQEECSEDFIIAKELLIQRARLAQLKQATFSFDTYASHEQLNQPVCKFSDLLPANLNETVSGKKGINSELKARFDFGRSQKQSFYQEEINKANIEKKVNISELTFTNDIQDLASNPPQEFSAMAGKVAYIYLDGNKFSSIQSSVVKDVASQIEFDKEVQNLRANFLNKFITFAKERGGYFTGNGHFRFETLMWGGDEMLFVLPAWKGFEFIDFFLKESNGWKYNNIPLTHSLGMVFCSHKSSVHTMRQLATDLADRVKQITHEPDEKDQENKIEAYFSNKYDYMVLESIDYPNESLKNHFNQQYQALGQVKHDNCFSSVTEQQLDNQLLLQQLKLINKSQIYQLAKKSMQLAKTNNENKSVSDISTDSRSSENELSIIENRVNEISEGLDIKKLKALLLTFFFGDTFNASNNNSAESLYKTTLLSWVLLAESWDYINCLATSDKGEK